MQGWVKVMAKHSIEDMQHLAAICWIFIFLVLDNDLVEFSEPETDTPSLK